MKPDKAVFNVLDKIFLYYFFPQSFFCNLFFHVTFDLLHQLIFSLWKKVAERNSTINSNNITIRALKACDLEKLWSKKDIRKLYVMRKTKVLFYIFTKV